MKISGFKAILTWLRKSILCLFPMELLKKNKKSPDLNKLNYFQSGLSFIP
jgi:hypothetical protein